MTEHVFPFLNYWWFYAAFTGLVVALLALVFSANPCPCELSPVAFWPSAHSDFCRTRDVLAQRRRISHPRYPFV